MNRNEQRERIREVLNKNEVGFTMVNAGDKTAEQMAESLVEQLLELFTTNQQILDRIELKLLEHLSKQYLAGVEGKNHSASDTANYLVGFLIEMLHLEITDEKDTPAQTPEL